ncbi:MAG: hypothetical protein QW448_06505, partial [Thermofilaceae archaeon]
MATFLLGVGFFVEYSGFVGYLALSLMATSSIALGVPFTLQVSRRDWPEVYWRDRAFLQINNLVSAAWALVFTTNALVYLFLKHPYSAAVSNVLVVLGTAFSVVFPARASAFFVAKRYVEPLERFDW